MGRKEVFSTWPIRRKLSLLLLVFFLPACGLIIQSGLERRNQEIAEASENGRRLVQSLASQQEQIAAGIRQVLSTLTLLPEVQRLDAAACGEIFRKLHEKNPTYSTIGLATPGGTVLATSPAFVPGSVNIADRKHVRDVISTLDFSAGEYIVGRVSKVPSINYGFPVLSPEGKLLAVVIAGFKLEEFSRYFQKANMPEGSSLSISDHTGKRLFRLPQSDRVNPGKPHSEDVIKTLLGNVDHGVYERVGQDGTRRIYAFKQLRLRDGMPPYMFMTVGIPKDPIVHAANMEMLSNLLVLGFVTCAAFLLAWSLGHFVFIRPISSLAAAARRFGSGEMDSRTGLLHSADEFGQLARAFDEMASLLEMRDNERVRAEKELQKAHDELEIKVAERTAELAGTNETLRREISERQQVESRLRESEERYRSFIETANEGVWAIDDGERIVFQNQVICDLLGYEMSEMAGRPLFDFFFDEDAADHESRMRNRRDGISERYERRLRRKDGGAVWTIISAKALLDDTGQFHGSFAMLTDITRRKQMEEALQESELRYRTLFETASDAITLMDGEKIIDCNLRAVSLLGVNDKCQIIGFTPAIFAPEKQPGGRSSKEVASEHVAAALTGENQEFYWQNRRKDGSIVDVEVTLNRFVLGGNVYIQAVSKDVTERKRAEEEKQKLSDQLRQAQKMEAVGRLAGGVAHDFNNMLGVILGYAELLKSKLPPGDSLHKDVCEIERAGIRSRDITRQLLAFSRKQIISPKKIELNGLVEGMLKTLSTLIGEDIELLFFPGRHLTTVHIDPSQVDQILVNLAANARDAMPEGGRLTLETGNVTLDEAYCADNLGFQPGNYVMLAVTDNGIGMDKETLQHAFEPFFTTKDSSRGTGLGLATVYGIVKQNGGFINAYSEPEQGTIFKIYLPCTADPAEEFEEIPQRPIVTGAGTILVVEDEEMIREMTAIMLERSGYKVLTARTPADALSLFQSGNRQIDLLLTDVVMPGMSGKELADQLARMKPGLKVLFMSGYTSNVIVTRGVLEEGVNFIPKPFSIEELCRKVGETIGTP